MCLVVHLDLEHRVDVLFLQETNVSSFRQVQENNNTFSVSTLFSYSHLKSTAIEVVFRRSLLECRDR